MPAWTDIRAEGWVSHLPPALRPYALLARLDRPIGTWLLFLPGLWTLLLARAVVPVPWADTGWLVALFAVGAVAMRSAGCVVNDMWDREMDRKVSRTAGRPLASGAIRMRGALLFLFVLLATGLLILLQLPRPAQWLGVASLVLVATYPLAKRVTWWPQAVLGLTFGWGAPMGWASAGGAVTWPGMLPGLLAYAAAFAWTLGYDTIYAHQDREDDALVGVRSTARLFGHNTRPFLAVCYMATLALLAAAMWSAGMRQAGLVALALPAAALGWQVWKLDIDDPEGCLRLFKLNRETGLLVAFALLLATA